MNRRAFTERNLHVHKEFGHSLTSVVDSLHWPRFQGAAARWDRYIRGGFIVASYFAHQRFMERLGFAPG